MWKRCAALLSVAVAGCAVSTAVHEPSSRQPACEVPQADQAWIERAVSAWHMAKHDIAGIGDIENFSALFFSADCLLTSSNALIATSGNVVWDAHRHDGTVVLPDGNKMTAVVTSFTIGDDDRSFFVMSTPSVWRTAGVDGGPLGLETLMVAVMLHEGSHVAQSPTYGVQVTELQRRFSLPESFSDDSLQARYEDEEAFGASIARETELFFQAAAAVDDAAAHRLAREARDLMRARADRWYTDDDAYWREGEDIWLTFEGSGQWVGYQWLTSDRGAAVTPSVALEGFGRRSKWWSQNEGLGIVLTLDRLGDASWKRHAFGDGAKTLLEMLDDVLD